MPESLGGSPHPKYSPRVLVSTLPDTVLDGFGVVTRPLRTEMSRPFFLESTFKDQINPKRQTAGPPEGGSPELDLEMSRP